MRATSGSGGSRPKPEFVIPGQVGVSPSFACEGATVFQVKPKRREVPHAAARAEFQGSPVLAIELRIVSSLRIHAVRATFLGFPLSTKRR